MASDLVSDMASDLASDSGLRLASDLVLDLASVSVLVLLELCYIANCLGVSRNKDWIASRGEGYFVRCTVPIMEDSHGHYKPRSYL